MPNAIHLARSSFFSFLCCINSTSRVATKKGFELLFEVHKVDLHSFNSSFDLLEADLLVGFVGTIDCLLVAVLLDDLAAVPDFVEAQSR